LLGSVIALVAGIGAFAPDGHRAVVDAAADAPCAITDLAVPTEPSYSFAVVGDFGDFPAAGRVAAQIASWQPTFVATLGDNAYNPDAPADGAGGFVWTGSKIDRGVGQWYWPWIGAYRGAFGGGPSPTRPSRFFRTLGNHDWDATPGGAVYAGLPDAAYYSLPGNERYYAVRAGDVELFVLDGDPRSVGATGGRYEPDGVSADSVQASWLRAHLADSTARWKIVLVHFPMYTSASRGPTTVLRWPFADWGASLVLAGHEHQYERLVGPDGLPYVVAGNGGNVLTTAFPGNPAPATSLVRVPGQFGALRFDVTPTSLTMLAVGQPSATPTAPFGVVDQLSVPLARTQVVRPACVLHLLTTGAESVGAVPAVRLGPVATP
jgi:hypothetical protein